MSSSIVRVRLGWALAILFLAIAGPAWSDDPKQEAKARYTTGQSHYNLNEFQEALQDFKEAYRLFPDPVFLFNVAQCERQLGNLDEAIRFYRSYLRNKPRAPNRQEVERRIDEMQAVIDAKKLASEKPPVNLVPPAAVDEPRVTAPVPSATEAAAPPALDTTQTVVPTPTPAAAPAAPLSVLPATVEPAGRGDMQTGGSGPRTDLLAQSPSPAPVAAPAFYQRWWFWTGAAVVVAGVGVGVYALTTRAGNSAPSSKLGTQPVF